MKYTVTLTVPDGADTSEAALKKLAVQEIARLQKSQPHNKAGSGVHGSANKACGRFQGKAAHDNARSGVQGTDANKAGVRFQGTGARITEKDISAFVFKKKSLDARRNQIKAVFRYDVYTDGDKPDEADGALRSWQDVREGRDGKQVVIIGDGPAGLFAALRLLEDGIKPVIIERGPEASQRKRDIADISRTGSVHADSNYCFGEGGAGTFSDGKLFSRSNKRGNIDKILQIFALHGAQASVTTDAHPHIGTDRLPAIIGAMNETIRSHGGEVHFNTRCDRLIVEDNRVTGVSCIDTLTGSRSEYRGKAVILATGHSAPDIYEMIAAANPAALEAKTFAAGVRVEHPREMIDRIQYHGRERGEDLPAAEYRLTTQVDGRGVYSFCMCPGGLVVPSASAPGGVVVNGMSPSDRNARWSNAAIVVELRPEDFSATDPLSGLSFRTQIEQKAYSVCHESTSNVESTFADKAAVRLEGTGAEAASENSSADKAADRLEGIAGNKAPDHSQDTAAAQDPLAGLRFRTLLEQAAYAACHESASGVESTVADKTSVRLEGTGAEAAFESTPDKKTAVCLQGTGAEDTALPSESIAGNKAPDHSQDTAAAQDPLAELRFRTLLEQAAYAACHESATASESTPDKKTAVCLQGTGAAAFGSTVADKTSVRLEGTGAEAAFESTPDKKTAVCLQDTSAEDTALPSEGIAGNKAPVRPQGTGAVNPQAAPAQRLVDFLEGRLSDSLPESSYTPGLVSARLDLLLPEHISRRLKQAFRDFDRNMHGFICEEALLIAPETRTSTPVRILRDKETRESPVLKGLYPAGEGSGYAGGITSSAMDGESTAALISGLV